MSDTPEPYSMLKWATVESARVGNTEFVLARHGDDWVVRVDQRVLMSNRVHASDVSLAEHGIDRADDPQHVLVGGLGLGYTLRATLDLLPETARVTVAELVPELVDWNRRLLNHLNDDALQDPRCEVVVGDAYDVISRGRGKFDVILLDVDNGPQALSQVKNQRLYTDAGTRACWNALTPGGVLCVWSNGPNAKYTARLKRFGFDPEVLFVPAGTTGRMSHVLFIGTKPAADGG
jgi:spermidine synthase